MKLRVRPTSRALRSAQALCCAILLLPGEGLILAQEKTPPPQTPPKEAGAAQTEASKITADQLDSLVAPIALYPDSLLAQTLVASTYPLEIIQLYQWLAKNKDLKDKALADAVAKQPWDPSVQSMAAVPEVVKRLADDVQWTTDLGNAFLAQQSDVMDAVQRMRKKAQDKGALKSSEQQKVETKVIEEKTVIVVESADPEVIYVPSYSPVVVYGPPVYPYPPIYYPPYPYGAAFVSFSFGVMIGAGYWGGSCCACGWGGNDIDINVENNFNNIEHHGDRGGSRGEGNRGGGGQGGGKWQHNPEHRGAAPYGDKATANKYGGSARGESRGGRQPSASQRGGSGTRGGAPSASDRSSGGASKRGGAPSAGDRSASSKGSRGGSGGGDKIGSRNIPKSSGSRSGGFGGGSSGFSGSSARASSSRGGMSMGGRGGGGRRR